MERALSEREQFIKSRNETIVKRYLELTESGNLTKLKVYRTISSELPYPFDPQSVGRVLSAAGVDKDSVKFSRKAVKERTDMIIKRFRELSQKGNYTKSQIWTIIAEELPYSYDPLSVARTLSRAGVKK